jgi:hypothetical protein
VSLVAKLRLSSFLFLGYSLRDWEQRVLVRPLVGREPLSYMSWAVVNDPSLVERAMWGRWNVQPFDIRLRDYVEMLRGAAEAIPWSR